MTQAESPSVTPGCFPTETPDDVDIPALRDKYRAERDKRLRSDGSTQYLELTADLAAYADVDPHIPFVERDPQSIETDVLILGGGFAGLLTAVALKKAGVEDIRILDMAGDFGGVWYWNRFPGVQCDNDSYCYIPLLEELDYLPTRKFADGSEIFAHCQRIGKHFGLYDGAIFSTQARDLKWDDEITRWRVATNRGDDIRARFVVMAAGSFNRPKLPGIPGLTDFTGHMFHSSRWDYEYTGGDASGGLNKLADKKVAVIGTGATAVQIVPHLARGAKHLYVFQRTPSSVDARHNTPTDPEWASALVPGWQAERQRNFHAWAFEVPLAGRPDHVCDFWTEVGRNMAAELARRDHREEVTAEELADLREQVDYWVMERLRRRIDAIVEDPVTAEKLKPYYRFLCKRPCSNDDYLPAFNRGNVTLVDVSHTRGVERVTATGIMSGGVEYDVDCLVFASGFEITTEISRRYAIDTIEGRSGVSLFDHWRDGYRTLHGMVSHGFPNLLFTGFSQAGVAASNTAMYEQQGEHIAYLISEAFARGVRAVEPTQHGQDDWCQVIKETALPGSGFETACTPGYYNNEGGGGGEGLRSHLGEPYGPGFYAFGQLLADWRTAGNMEGMELRS
jgi:cyclohexanone monooxygenase